MSPNDAGPISIPLGLAALEVGRKAIAPESIDPMAFLTVLVPVLVALVGGWFTYRAGMAKAGSDATTQVQQGFQMLVGKLQEERAELTKVIDKQAAENVSLHAEVNALTKTVHRLEGKLDDVLKRWRRGDPPPPEEEPDGSNRQ